VDGELAYGVGLILLIIGIALYLTGYISAVVVAHRKKRAGRLVALLLIGPIAYPFLALKHRRSSRTTFRLFWVGLSVLILGGVLLAATRPPYPIRGIETTPRLRM
jgi:uncharacterized membrane protein